MIETDAVRMCGCGHDELTHSTKLVADASEGLRFQLGECYAGEADTACRCPKFGEKMTAAEVRATWEAAWAAVDASRELEWTHERGSRFVATHKGRRYIVDGPHLTIVSGGSGRELYSTRAGNVGAAKSIAQEATAWTFGA